MTIFELPPSELTALAVLLGINISKSYTVQELEILVSLLEVLIGILDLTIVSNEKEVKKHSDFVNKI
ncbi:hypothetical protein [Clostridium tarantellae]|uniref:Uncharacterized protein n=1 Tax=Clostridium tarantellae TaxID=39493 RepID=A0A6I1MLU1_9CLOT|nr:hypothetical protein [Clostridium tarantellae]MPQ44395.1 hypothetical protein [Clostridium tarantellae]